MIMKIWRIEALIGVLLLASFTSCGSIPNSSTNQMDPETRKRVSEACYEIVVNKPEKDTLSYEKELPWDLIPYNIRNDKYYSIGTAFAVSPTELYTAFHVLDLKSDSQVYKDFYIRDKEGKVYEIDSIVSFDSHRDFIRFTVKDRKFTTYLNLRNSYAVGETVYAVGNAYGEGIVIRGGELIGTYPEEEEGRFNLLKSSSDVNFGNSGGPLVDSKGNVIGIVIQRKDNIAYSLPMMEAEKNKGEGIFHVRHTYGFLLLPQKRLAKSFDYSTKLPQNYKEIKKEYKAAYEKEYIKAMEELFETQGKGLFPKGEESLIPLFDFADSFLLQVNYLNNDNNRWYMSNISYTETKIQNNGVVRVANPDNSVFFVDITRPDNIPLQELIKNQKAWLDLFLQGKNINRDFSNVKIRILSFGQPVETEAYIDTYERKWQIATWILDFSDEAVIACSTPTPEGISAVIFVCNTDEIELYKYDALKTLNNIQLSYYASLKNWKDFLALKEYLPQIFKKIDMTYTEQQRLAIKTPNISINLNNNIFPINDEIRLGINMGYLTKKGNVSWDIRRILIGEYQKDNYIELTNWVSPDPRLPKDYITFWENIVNEEHPYTMKPFVHNKTTQVASVIKKYYTTPEEVHTLYTLFLVKTGTVEEAKILEDYKKALLSIEINQ